MQNIIFDTIGIISQAIQSDAYAIVDEIISIANTNPDEARELIVRIIREKNSTAMKKAVEEAEKVAKKKKFN